MLGLVIGLLGLPPPDAILSSLAQVTFDTTKHLSELAMKRRLQERQKLQELERQREEQKRREKEEEERRKEEER